MPICADNHDGTCTAVLSRHPRRPGKLVATLVCERCDQTLKVLGVYEYRVQPVLVQTLAELAAVAA